MKREGRQHGMVRSYRILPAPLNPRRGPGPVNRFDSLPTAGLFTKVPSKPTNHSKFTGKCGQTQCTECRMHPTCKSKDKTKGTQKVKSRNVATNHKLISWRVVDGPHGLKVSGFSATELLDHLSTYHVSDYDYDYDCDQDYDGDDSILDYRSCSLDEEIVEEEVVEISQIVEHDSHNGDHGNGEKDHFMSFDDVGIVFSQVEEDDGWCLVEEMK